MMINKIKHYKSTSETNNADSQTVSILVRKTLV